MRTIAFPGSTWKRVPVALLLIAGSLLLSGCPEKVSLAPGDTPPGKHLMRLAIITDIHILDEESPARLVRFDRYIPSSWRPQDAYTAQVLDATIQRINAIHETGSREGRPIDALIACGDLTDNAQYNELRWFIDIMDGKTVSTDSGDADGVNRDVAEADNPKLSFDAAGLNPEIPWYAVHGNHDALAVGSFAIDQSSENPEAWNTPLLYLVAQMAGLNHISFFLNCLIPTLAFSPAVITADRESADPETMRLDMDRLEAGPITPDPARHYLSRRLFMEAFFDTETEPVGHGFKEANLDYDTAFYSFRPRADVPIRIVVLDSAHVDPPWSVPADYGSMDRGQFNGYLKTVVEKATEDGEYVIVVSHHSSKDFNNPYPGHSVKGFEFEGYLASQPHVIAHLNGHDHWHITERMPGPNPYLRIGTASLIDLPQDGRLIDIYWSDAEQRPVIESTFFGHMENPTRLSEESFRRAAFDRGLRESEGY